MHTSNHTGNHTSRLYNLTPAGSRLAHYLFYVEQQPVTPDLRFADVPAEQHDDDRPLTQVQRLERELDEALRILHNSINLPDYDFLEARERVKELRLKLYAIENPPVAPEPLLEPDDGYDDDEDEIADDLYGEE